MAEGVGMNEERMEEWWGRRTWALLSTVRARAPLLQCITYLVSMDIATNALTAAGASPAMLHCIRELPDLTPRCGAVCINVGTLSEDWLPSMRAAASAGRPWVLDPVAAAASGFRMEACLQLLALRPAVVRGNASEILSLASRSDSSFKVVSASNGVAMMQKITATGCAGIALIAAFVGADPSDALAASACALAIFGLAGQIGMESAKGPASLRVHLIDALYGLDEQTRHIRGQNCPSAVNTCVRVVATSGYEI